ncbi:MAG: spermidine/putrescine ABC transporter substrate-binding protein [Clostridia bacterium]|nr:spermidine/putrescine ABC transporter substrate-binding protein [Clostridia bacterium]MDR3645476.1 spermidine/putrescine ABC transporter substrate-binding protein [Clostridia bacterium]
MKFKTFFFALLIAAVCLPFAGCARTVKPTQTINVYNWGEYIDESVNAEFTKETGIRVNYTTYATNEELYSKLKAGGVNYDVVVPSDYMISRMISENMLEKIDFSQVPNYKDIGKKYHNLAYDPNDTYSVPYMWGTVGIIYDKTKVTGNVNSWNILWDARYKGQILMFDNSRDSIGIALKKLGYSYNTINQSQLEQAAAELTKQKPLVQAYVMDQIFDKMEGGEALIAPYYAGDAITMMQENPNLAFAVPKEGTNFFVDAMAIPKGALNKKAAETYINFMCSAKICAKNAEYTGYSTPSGAALKLLPASLRDNIIAYPGDSVLNKSETYTNLPESILKLYDQLWTQVIS